MSFAMIRPPGPLPCTCSMLTPSSRAIFRASGDERRRPLSPPGFAVSDEAAEVRSTRGAFMSIASAYSPVECLTESFLSIARRAGCSAAGAAASFFGCASSPAPRIVASTPPTSTVFPASAATSPSVPSCSASRSRLTLSVSISSTGSPFFTASPAFLYQRTTFPSAIASPILGMMISAIRVHHFLHRRDDVLLVRRRQQLEIARVRHRHVLARDARHRRIELVEDVLGDAGRDLRRRAERLPLLLHDDAAMRSRNRLVRGIEIERAQRTKVDDLALDAFFGELLGRDQRHLQHAAVRNDGDVAPLARDARDTEGNGEIGIVRNFALHAVQRGA